VGNGDVHQVYVCNNQLICLGDSEGERERREGESERGREGERDAKAVLSMRRDAMGKCLGAAMGQRCHIIS
jgi:hypothetical protein